MNWQPIETAPKDGTPILVCDGDRQIVVAEWTAQKYHAEAHWSLSGVFWADETSRVYPTHWIPLPQPPCSTCGGSGIVIDYMPDGEGEHRVDSACPDCETEGAG